MRCSLKVYGKLNLALDIKGVEPNGFHLLDTVMVSINMYDTVSVVSREDSQVNIKYIRNESEITYANDITYQAACDFVSKFSTNGADILVVKGIWDAAGLGSSSADIVGVVAALARIYRVETNLTEFVTQYASDGAFMLQGGLAHVSGIGEIVHPLKFVPLNFWVVKPKGGVRTEACYKKFDELGWETQVHSVERVLHTLAQPSSTYYDVLTVCFNELYTAAIELNPNIENIAVFLRDNARKGVMSGSGSTLFSIVSKDDTTDVFLNAIARYHEYGGNKLDKYGVYHAVEKGVELIELDIND